MWKERGKRAREGRVFIINVMGREVVVVVMAYRFVKVISLCSHVLLFFSLLHIFFFTPQNCGVNSDVVYQYRYKM